MENKTPDSPVNKKLSTFKILFAILITIVLIIISAVSFIILNKDNENSENDKISKVIEREGESRDILNEEKEANGEVILDQTYINEQFGVSFKYPSGWNLIDECRNLDQKNTCDINVNYNGYKWSFEIDPPFTGFNAIDIRKGEVSDIEVLDEQLYLISIYNQTTQAWEQSNIFQKKEGEYILGFGTGELNDNISNNYYAIRYLSNATHGEFRGIGLNSAIKPFQFLGVVAAYGLLPSAFTDDIPSYGEHPHTVSGSMGNLERLGYIPKLISHMKEYDADFAEEMYGPCPEGRCAPRGDNYPDCSCKLWIAQYNMLNNAMMKISLMIEAES